MKASTSFSQKRSKKLLLLWGMGCGTAFATPPNQIKKKFLRAFFKKHCLPWAFLEKFLPKDKA
jgi:hypothetical protein